jgi:cobalt-zinc-cadmium resistance protein CzcA
MNSKEEFTIANKGDFGPMTLGNAFDTTLIANNPALKLLVQEAVIAEKTKKVEVASALPDFNVGYFSQTLIGTQNVDGSEVFYGGDKRFQGFNVGIAVPLTFFSNAARVKSLGIRQQALKQEADNGRLVMQTQLQNAFQQYEQDVSHYEYYRTSALPNADMIISTAKVGFRSGDIGYIEYLQALQTASEVQLNYLQSIDRVNQSIININFLTNK